MHSRGPVKELSMKAGSEQWVDRELQGLMEKDLFREIPVRQKMPSLSFCSNDYLGLSLHPDLKEAAFQAIREWGTGSGGSRLLSGTFSQHHLLERELAAWYRKESALIFSSGYHTGIGAVTALSRNGTIFSDEMNHSCLIDGCRLSRAEVVIYRHRDMAHLEHLMKKHRQKSPRWIVTESLFSMEGEKAPLKDLVFLKERHDALLFVDEAHAIGLYGKSGKGLAEELHLLDRVDLIMGTFSKALGSFGGFVAGKRKMITLLANLARPFLFTTSLPPAIPAVNREAIRIVPGMGRERGEIRLKAKEVRGFFRELGLSVRGDDSPIIPVILGEASRALTFSRSLLQEEIWIPAIRPPTVPPGTSRLRVTLSLTHQACDYQKLFEAFRQVVSTEEKGGRRGDSMSRRENTQC